MPLFGLPPAMVSKVLLSAAILGGVMMCFFGFRLFKLALGLGGFACGAVIGAYIAWTQMTGAGMVQTAPSCPEVVEVIKAMLNAENPTVLLVCAGVGGVAGAVLSVLLRQVGLFVLGAWLGTMLAGVTMVKATADARLIAFAILALIGGILALILRRVIVVLSTALNGALALMFGMYALLKNLSPRLAVSELQTLQGDAWVVIGCTIVIGTIGAFVQFAMLPDDKKPEPVYKKVKKKSD